MKNVGFIVLLILGVLTSIKQKLITPCNC